MQPQPAVLESCTVIKRRADTALMTCSIQCSALSSALDEQPEECLKCFCAACHEARTQAKSSDRCFILGYPLPTVHVMRARAGCQQSLRSPGLHQALSGVHRAELQQLLGRTIPQMTITVHVFNYKTSVTVIASIKSSCIGAPPLFISEHTLKATLSHVSLRQGLALHNACMRGVLFHPHGRAFNVVIYLHNAGTSLILRKGIP